MLSVKNQKGRRVVFDAVFLALALILSYLEFLFPVSLVVPLPGFKLGFANLVILALAVHVSMMDAGVVSLLRVTLVAMLFGNMISFWFSLCGALFSLAVIFLGKRVTVFSYIGLSVLSATGHNIGQLVAAVFLFGWSIVWSYLPVMLVASVLFGTICGILLNFLMPRIGKAVFGK